MRDYRCIPMWRDVSPKEWTDWHWQLRHRIRTRDQLEQLVRLSDSERRALDYTGENLPVAISPYYALLMHPTSSRCPIRRQAIPLYEEIESLLKGECEGRSLDPLGEEADSPVPHITHRYPDRVLFVVTEMCAVYCRHCTRRRFVGTHEGALSKDAMDEAVQYIANNHQIRDVVISGGDPLIMGEERLGYLLGKLRAIPHVEIIRIGTRMPVTNPYRITPSLVETLKQFHPLWVNTQFNHPAEVTKEAAEACARLADAGIPLGNQTVLLRGINDRPDTQKALAHELLKMRVRPYYLYQCDPVRGIEHFCTPVATGINIMEHLIGHTSGLGVPRYVIDAPGGGGKIPLLPQYRISESPDKVLLRNYEGEIYHYPEVGLGRIGTQHHLCTRCKPE